MTDKINAAPQVPTPRTDAECLPASAFSPNGMVVTSYFARKLERELVAAKQDSWRRLEAHNSQQRIAIQMQIRAEKAEAALAEYKRMSESGESLGGELEERERRMEAEAALIEEKAIVNRIWSMFGSPTYEDLNGRSIYDLVQEGLNAKKRLDNAGTVLPIAAWRWLTTCGFAYHENGPPAKTLPAAETMCLLADANAAIAKRDAEIARLRKALNEYSEDEILLTKEEQTQNLRNKLVELTKTHFDAAPELVALVKAARKNALRQKEFMSLYGKEGVNPDALWAAYVNMVCSRICVNDALTAVPDKWREE